MDKKKMQAKMQLKMWSNECGVLKCNEFKIRTEFFTVDKDFIRFITTNDELIAYNIANVYSYEIIPLKKQLKN